MCRLAPVGSSFTFLAPMADMSSPFLALPVELQVRSIKHVNLTDVPSLTRVCRALAEVCESGGIWKRLCFTELGVFFRHGAERPSELVGRAWKDIFRNLFDQQLSFPHYNNVDENKLGCAHYQRRNMLRARCCEKFYVCRICHDETEGHKIDRFETQHMLCMVCGCVQNVAQNCTYCCTPMASNFCFDCKLWSDDPDRPIYHCDKCAICRVGGGLGIDNWHCDTCGICFSLSAKQGHVCNIKEGLRTLCPVCRRDEFVFFSRDPIVLLNCGHGVHLPCYPGLIAEYNGVCPFCHEAVNEEEVNLLEEGEDEEGDEEFSEDSFHSVDEDDDAEDDVDVMNYLDYYL